MAHRGGLNCPKSKRNDSPFLPRFVEKARNAFFDESLLEPRDRNCTQTNNLEAVLPRLVTRLLYRDQKGQSEFEETTRPRTLSA